MNSVIPDLNLVIHNGGLLHVVLITIVVMHIAYSIIGDGASTCIVNSWDSHGYLPSLCGIRSAESI